MDYMNRQRGQFSPTNLDEYFLDVIPQVLGVEAPGGLLAHGAASRGVGRPGDGVDLQALGPGEEFVQQALGGGQNLLRQLWGQADRPPS